MEFWTGPMKAVMWGWFAPAYTFGDGEEMSRQFSMTTGMWVKPFSLDASTRLNPLVAW